mgnify:CR=1 FL=1|jgi:hypothetical protein
MLRTIVFAIPVFGWLLKSAYFGGDREKVMFVINMALIWLLAIYLFGYPAVIIPAVAAAGLYLAALVIFTAGDF